MWGRLPSAHEGRSMDASTDRPATLPLAKAAPTWIALVLAGAAAWGWVVGQGFDMGNGVGTMGTTFAFFAGMWAVMMAAMMLPALGPVAAAETAGGSTVSGVGRIPDGLAFGAGFLAPWALYGVAAFFAFRGADRLVDSSPDGARWLGVGILAVAGLYQLSPWKWAALRHCRMAMHRPASGLGASLVTGAVDGATCVGCCLFLMATLVSLGVMNLAAMGGLAALIFAEKVLPRPRLIAAAGGMAFLALAVAASVHPALLPGLHGSGMGADMTGGM
jgi:predicted metal-binding membrane protein